MHARHRLGVQLESVGNAGLSVRSLFRVVVVATCLALGACTTVGMHTKQRMAVDYGPPVQMRVCVLKAPGVSTQRVDELIGAVNEEFAAYGIEVIVPWMRPWTRPGFTLERMFDDVAQRELEAPCDRLMAFGDRNFGDFLWGLAMPEELGAVDVDTHTHGYVVATRASINQLIKSPAEVTIHEFYHLLGCQHAAAMSDCYARIAALKRSYDPRADFLPGIGPDARFVLTRNEVNAGTQVASGLTAQQQLLSEEAVSVLQSP